MCSGTKRRIGAVMLAVIMVLTSIANITVAKGDGEGNGGLRVRISVADYFDGEAYKGSVRYSIKRGEGREVDFTTIDAKDFTHGDADQAGTVRYKYVLPTQFTTGNGDFQLQVGDTIEIEIIPEEGYKIDETRGIQMEGQKMDLDRLDLISITLEESKEYEIEFGFEAERNDDSCNPNPDNPNPGAPSGASKEYNFNGEAQSSLNITTNGFVDGGGKYIGADFFINGVRCQEQTDEEIVQKTNVTYPYDEEDSKTPVITVDNEQVPAVEFEFRNSINARYTEIKINGVDYSSYIPGSAEDLEEAKWQILDAMDLNGDPQSISFIITVPKADNYEVIARLGLVDGEEATEELTQRYFPTGNFLWSNLDKDKDRDVYLDHTIVQFVKFSYEDRKGETITFDSLEEMLDENHTYLNFDDNEDAGEATLIAGGRLTVKLIPRYGYQVVEFGPNGMKREVSSSNACEYTFTIDNGNAHIGAKCEPVADEVSSSTDEITSGKITLDENELSMGTAVLDVSDTKVDEAEKGEFIAAADGYAIDSYLDLNLLEVVYQGSKDSVWSSEITQLKEEAAISLKVSGELSEDVKIIHQKHDGKYEILEAVYDEVSKTVTFKTNGFSKYAIATKEDVSNNGVKDKYELIIPTIGEIKDITGSKDVNQENNPYKASVGNVSVLATKEEIALGVNVWVNVKDATDSVTDADKKLVKEALEDNTLGMYIDITLLKKVGNNNKEQLTDIDDKVKISFAVPEKLIKEGRTFAIIRVHDGKAETLKCTFDKSTGLCTFETDKFSTYALVYSDETPTTGEKPTTGETPNTGDTARVVIFIIVAVMGGVSAMAIFSLTKKNNLR